VAGDEQRFESDAPEQVDEQRERLIAAFAKAAAERGYALLDLNQVAREAGVSRSTFEAHFKSKEQGLVAAQDAFFDRLRLEVLHACEGPGEWPLKVRAALEATLAFLVEASTLARVFTIEAAAASLVAAERQSAALERFADLLRQGREHYPAASSLPDATERLLVGGVASIVSTHLLVENPQAIPVLEDQLVELVLIPYLGAAEARRVITG
jgi:AcrR family transcriptional regulator